MVHAREDYMRFQDPAIEDSSLLEKGSTPIKQDEPVMLFRAQDIHFIGVLEDYANRLDVVGNHEVSKKVREHIQLASEWRAANGCKEPDL